MVSNSRNALLLLPLCVFLFLCLSERFHDTDSGSGSRTSLQSQEVDNLPHSTHTGSDAQLEAAVAHLLGLINDDPRDVPPPPEFPDRKAGYPDYPDSLGSKL